MNLDIIKIHPHFLEAKKSYINNLDFTLEEAVPYAISETMDYLKEHQYEKESERFVKYAQEFYWMEWSEATDYYYSSRFDM